MITITRSASGAPWYSTRLYCRPVRAANLAIAVSTTAGTRAWMALAASRIWK